MVIKSFPLDKNYILKEVQFTLKNKLLADLVQEVKEIYQVQYNPLGLKDTTSQKIASFQLLHNNALDIFYFGLADIYRYKYGEVQLQILFDGRTHFDKYSDEWKMQYLIWIKEFCKKPFFIRAVLQIIIENTNSKQRFIEVRLKSMLHEYFSIQLKKHKGVPAFKIA